MINFESLHEIRTTIYFDLIVSDGYIVELEDFGNVNLMFLVTSCLSQANKKLLKSIMI